MKKLFLFFAMAIVVAACSTKSVEDQAEARFEQIVQAVEEGNTIKASGLFYDLAEWSASLSEEDQQKVEAVSKKYTSQISGLFGAMGMPEDGDYGEYEEYGEYDGYDEYDENEESEQSSEEVTAKAQEYCDKIVKALRNGDFEKAEDLMDDMIDWQESLNYEE